MITSLTRSLVSNKSWYRSMLAGNDAFNPGSYELISTTVLGSNQASITFTSGGWSSYKHLQLRIVARSTEPANQNALLMRLNSDTSANYTEHVLYGNGTNALSAAGTGNTFAALGLWAGDSATSGNFGAGIVDILDFASTSKNKTIRSFSGITQANYVQLRSSLWLSTSAITSIQVYPNLSANLMTGTRISLYGIKG